MWSDRGKQFEKIIEFSKAVAIVEYRIVISTCPQVKQKEEYKMQTMPNHQESKLARAGTLWALADRDEVAFQLQWHCAQA